MIISKIGILRNLLMALLAIACLSCERVTFNYLEVVRTVHNSRIEGKTVENPYSLRIMQAALDSRTNLLMYVFWHRRYEFSDDSLV